MTRMGAAIIKGKLDGHAASSANRRNDETFFLWYCGAPEAVFLERARKKKGFTLLWWLGFVTHRLAQTQSCWAGACKHLQVATLVAKASVNWTHMKHWNIIEYCKTWMGRTERIQYEYSTFGCNLLVYVSKKRIGFLGPLSWCPWELVRLQLVVPLKTRWLDLGRLSGYTRWAAWRDFMHDSKKKNTINTFGFPSKHITKNDMLDASRCHPIFCHG